MDLKSVTLKGRKHEVRRRIARGLGSGLGKTAGRGHKGWGQRSGASRRPGYEGGQMPLYRRVPKRGFTNARFRTDYTVINVDLLESFEAGSIVDLEAVLARGLTRKEAPLFKVLGNGDLSHPLTVRAQKFSKSAATKIRAAGGTVVELDAQGRVRETPAEEPAPAKPTGQSPKSPKASGSPQGEPGGDESAAKAKKAKKKGGDESGGGGG